MQATNQIEWLGHEIKFIPVLSHKTLWSATLNELWFDGKLVAKSGGFCLSSEAIATVEHQGKSVSLIMKSSTRLKSLVNLNYTLLVEGKVISEGIAKTRIQW